MFSAKKTETLERRRQRIRKRILGTEARPRLSVYRSRSHIYAQIINDLTGRTVASASTLDAKLKTSLKATGTIEAAKAVGLLLAERAKEAHVGPVVFDRGGRPYHGRIKALADASREGGLQF